jgi:hypothetical protein
VAFSDSSSRRKLAEMKQTLAMARVSRDEIRAAHAQSSKQLTAAEAELATILRRSAMAAQINDTETVGVAARFAESQRSTIALLQRKVALQQDELALAERTVTEMEADLKAVTGIGPAPGRSTAADATGSTTRDDDAATADQSDYRELDAATRAQQADQRLAELKRKMGRG